MIEVEIYQEFGEEPGDWVFHRVSCESVADVYLLIARWISGAPSVFQFRIDDHVARERVDVYKTNDGSWAKKEKLYIAPIITIIKANSGAVAG